MFTDPFFIGNGLIEQTVFTAILDEETVGDRSVHVAVQFYFRIGHCEFLHDTHHYIKNRMELPCGY